MPQDSQLPPGASSRDLSTPSFLTRLQQAGRWLISGVKPDAFFSPQQPIAPQAPASAKGRAFDYTSGYNIAFTPRSTEPIGFEQLRFLADSCDMLRLVLETRKDQMASVGWTIKPREVQLQLKGEQGPKKPNPKAQEIEQFFKKPDGILTWKQWLRAILEDLFVIDAVSIYKRKTVGGKPYAYELMDGTTIFPMMNDDGRRPAAPDPAFQQITKGIPAADFTAEELLYLPRNVRTNRLYGFPPVQQIIVTVNTAILRAIHQLDYYTEGSIPDSIIGTPSDWQPEQIEVFQKQWDEMLAGNLSARRRAKFVPGEFKFQELKQPPLKDMYDEWLARVICFAFSISPEAFIQHMNRATAESAHDRALEEGLLPIQLWVKEFMDEIIAEDFDAPELEFSWEDDREVDPETQCSILVDYVKAGIKTVNEARSVLGDDPKPGVADNLMVETATGYVPLDSYDDQMQLQQQQADTAAEAAKHPPVIPGAGANGAQAPAKEGQQPQVGNNGATAAATSQQRKQPSPSRVKDKKKDREARIAATKLYFEELRKAGGRKPIPFQPAADQSGAERVRPERLRYLTQDWR